MENKRKAVAGRRRKSQRRAREEETVDGQTAAASGNGTLQELPRVTAATRTAVGHPSGPSSQFGGALDRGGLSGTGHGGFSQATADAAGDGLSGTGHGGFSQATADAAGDGITGISQAMAWLLAVNSGKPVSSSPFDEAARGAGGGSGYRAPSQGMLRPPLGNRVSGTGHEGFSQATPMLQQPVSNPDLGRGGGSAPVTMLQQPVGNANAYPASGSGTGSALVSRGSRTGTEQQPRPHGHGHSSGSGPQLQLWRGTACSQCRRLTMAGLVNDYHPGWFMPLCEDCARRTRYCTPELDLRLCLGQPASAAQGQQASSPSQPAAANARPCAHLHGNDQVCPRCYRSG